jgi:hypothetical protein
LKCFVLLIVVVVAVPKARVLVMVVAPKARVLLVVVVGLHVMLFWLLVVVGCPPCRQSLGGRWGVIKLWRVSGSGGVRAGGAGGGGGGGDTCDEVAGCGA